MQTNNKKYDLTQRKFKFVKQYQTIPIGSDLDVVRGTIYLNGGMLPSNYQIEFKKLIMSEIDKPNYLKEQTLIKDQF